MGALHCEGSYVHIPELAREEEGQDGVDTQCGKGQSLGRPTERMGSQVSQGQAVTTASSFSRKEHGQQRTEKAQTVCFVFIKHFVFPQNPLVQLTLHNS